MAGNRLVIATLVVFLAVGPFQAEAFFWWLRPKPTTASSVDVAVDSETLNAEESAVSSDECPATNDVLVHFAHETDCTKFYKCNWGEKVVQECPDNLEYNAEKEYCDYAVTAGCSVSKVQSEDTVDESAAAVNVAAENFGADDDEESDSESTTTSGTENCQGTCSDDDENEYLTYEDDSTKFCKCSNGTPYVFECPDGLEFNLAKEECDWPTTESS